VGIWFHLAGAVLPQRQPTFAPPASRPPDWYSTASALDGFNKDGQRGVVDFEKRVILFIDRGILRASKPQSLASIAITRKNLAGKPHFGLEGNAGE
jgi:hypothetical protein